MSKYQDALDKLYKAIDSEVGSYYYDVEFPKSIRTLQELVDKEKPMKVDIKSNKRILCDRFLITFVSYHKCPNKKCELHNNYKILEREKRCPECGQKLDWSDECEKED